MKVSENINIRKWADADVEKEGIERVKEKINRWAKAHNYEYYVETYERRIAPGKGVTYVAVMLIPDREVLPDYLRESWLKKKGVFVIYAGYGYMDHDGPLTRLWIAQKTAEVLESYANNLIEEHEIRVAVKRKKK